MDLKSVRLIKYKTWLQEKGAHKTNNMKYQKNP